MPALRPQLQPAAGRRVPLDEAEVPLADGWPRDPPPGVEYVDLPPAHTRPEHILRRLEDEEVAAAGLRVLPERTGITFHLEHASGHQVEEEQVLPRRPLPEQIARRQEGDEVAGAREVGLDALAGAMGDLPELARGGIEDEYLPADRAVAEEVGTRLEGNDRPYLAGHQLTGARADAVVGAARQPEEALKGEAVSVDLLVPAGGWGQRGVGLERGIGFEDDDLAVIVDHRVRARADLREGRRRGEGGEAVHEDLGTAGSLALERDVLPRGVDRRARAVHAAIAHLRDVPTGGVRPGPVREAPLVAVPAEDLSCRAAGTHRVGRRVEHHDVGATGGRRTGGALGEAGELSQLRPRGFVRAVQTRDHHRFQ